MTNLSAGTPAPGFPLHPTPEQSRRYDGGIATLNRALEDPADHPWARKQYDEIR
jgi:hypothetical protein